MYARASCQSSTINYRHAQASEYLWSAGIFICEVIIFFRHKKMEVISHPRSANEYTTCQVPLILIATDISHSSTIYTSYAICFPRVLAVWSTIKWYDARDHERVDQDALCMSWKITRGQIYSHCRAHPLITCLKK